MKKLECALWIAFLAALAMGYGCGRADSPHQLSNLNGKTYTEKYTCNLTSSGSPTSCSDLNAIDHIIFHKTGTDTYEVRDVPDSGFIYNGTMVGDDFLWTATSPTGYTESGTWTFSARRDSFFGSSHYVADDASYDGDCNANGLLGSATPPDPPFPASCP